MKISEAAGRQAHEEILARIRKLTGFRIISEFSTEHDDESSKTTLNFTSFRAEVILHTSWMGAEIEHSISGSTDFGAFMYGVFTNSQDELIYNAGQLVHFLSRLKQNVVNLDE